MRDMSVYSVGRNEHGFGFNVEGDSTYVQEEHDYEKSLLKGIVETGIKACKANGLEKYRFVSSYGPDERYVVGIITPEGASFINCNKEGKDIKAIFTKEEASELSKNNFLIMYRMDSYAKMQAQGKDSLELATGVTANIKNIEDTTIELTKQINLIRQSMEIEKQLKMPEAKIEREQVSLDI